MRRTLRGAALLACALAAFGCSSSSNTATTSTTQAAGSSATTNAGAAGGGSASDAAFCTAYFKVLDDLTGPSVASPDFLTTFKASFQALVASAPSAIQSDVGAMNTQLQAATSMDQLQSSGAAQNVANWAQANCPQAATMTTARP